MPGGLPIGLDLCNGQSLTAGNISFTASVGSKSAYTQIIASTAADTCWMCVAFITNVAASQAIDIAVGAAGSELVIVPNLMLQGYTPSGTTIKIGSAFYSFPLSIPQGTRIAVRSQASAAGSTFVNMWTFDAGFTQIEGIAGFDAIGWTSGTTLGTTLTQGSPAGTKGSYAQLIASTARDYIGLFGYVDSQNSTANANYSNTDIAVGASGSEQIIVPNWGTWLTQAQEGETPFFPIAIPAATRLSARSSGGASTTLGLTVYGAYQ